MTKPQRVQPGGNIRKTDKPVSRSVRLSVVTLIRNRAGRTERLLMANNGKRQQRAVAL